LESSPNLSHFHIVLLSANLNNLNSMILKVVKVWQMIEMAFHNEK